MQGGDEEDEKERRPGVLSVQIGEVSDLTFVLFRLCFHGNATEIMFNRYYLQFLILAANCY